MNDPELEFTDFSPILGDITPFNTALAHMRTMPNAEMTELIRWTDGSGIPRESEQLVVIRENGRDKFATNNLRKRRRVR